MPHTGSPAMKALVPSIGSSTQTYSASPPSVPNSSPTMPWVGKVRRMSCRIAASPARSASVTGSKAPPCDLSSAASAVRKKGRIAWPDRVASSLTNVRKVDRAHGILGVPAAAARPCTRAASLMPPVNGSGVSGRACSRVAGVALPATPRRSSARYAQIAWLQAWQGLQFVRRGVNCAVRYRDWRRGIAALLGRFLPRLGPHFGAAFFLSGAEGLLLGGDAVRRCSSPLDLGSDAPRRRRADRRRRRRSPAVRASVRSSM